MHSTLETPRSEYTAYMPTPSRHELHFHYVEERHVWHHDCCTSPLPCPSHPSTPRLFTTARGATPRAPPLGTANLRTKILDFRGFDSSRILIPKGGIPRSTGNLLEVLSQRILVGIILVGRSGVGAKIIMTWPRSLSRFRGEVPAEVPAAPDRARGEGARRGRVRRGHLQSGVLAPYIIGILRGPLFRGAPHHKIMLYFLIEPYL